MNIVPVSKIGPSRSAGLSGLSAAEVAEIIGFTANVTHLDDPGKVAFSWGFSVDGEEAFVWSYKGSHHSGFWSACGSKEVLVKVFGENHVEK